MVLDFELFAEPSIPPLPTEPHVDAAVRAVQDITKRHMLATGIVAGVFGSLIATWGYHAALKRPPKTVVSDFVKWLKS